jgi:hypothetical protein
MVKYAENTIAKPEIITERKDIFDFTNRSFEQINHICKIIADSDFAPKDYRGKPGNVLIAIQMGMELGLKPMQALQGIAVINGRPSIWGDAMLALVQSHHDYEYHDEKIKDGVAYCTIKRKGHPEYTYEFSVEDAKQAELINSTPSWKKYPKRMLQQRARGFALRNKFADALKGIITAEEAMDLVELKKIPNLNHDQPPISEKAASITSILVTKPDPQEIKETAKNEEPAIIEPPKEDEVSVFHKYEDIIKNSASLEDLITAANAINSADDLTSEEKQMLRKASNLKKEEF